MTSPTYDTNLQVTADDAVPAPATIAPSLGVAWNRSGVERLRKIVYLGALGVFFLAVYLLTASGDIQQNGDTVIRFQVAADIVNHHTPALLTWQIGPLTRKHPFRDPRVLHGRGHRIYAIYTVGQSLAGIPLYLLGKALAAHLNVPPLPTELFTYRLVGPIFGALLAVLVFLFCIRLGYSARLSFAMSLIFAFATSAWPDEQSALELTQESFFVLLAAYLAFRHRQGKAWPYLLLAGLSVGAGLLTRYTAAVAIPPIALYLALPEKRAWRWQSALGRNVLFGIGIIPMAAFDLWYNKLRFGQYTDSGHSEKIFGHPLLTGIGGLLISPGKGIIWYTPVIFLLLVAAPRFARRWPDVTGLFFAMTACYVVFYGNVEYWHGDPAWGPRYIYPILPYVILPVGEVFRLPGRWRWPARAVALAVIAVSLGIQIMAVTVSMWGNFYDIAARVLSQHRPWYWEASQYHYFWNWSQSPLLDQFQNFRRVVLIWIGAGQKYILVPPDNKPVLSQLIHSYPVNGWQLWWADPQFNWWIGTHRIQAMVVGLVAVGLAALIYVLLETVLPARTRDAAGAFGHSIDQAA